MTTRSRWPHLANSRTVGVFLFAFDATMSDRSRRAILFRGHDCHARGLGPGFAAPGRQGIGMMITPDQSSSDTNQPASAACTIRASAERRLERSGYAALRLVDCEFQSESGVLHLRGAVPSYYLKQLAQALAGDLEGVRFVDNQLNVARPRANTV